MLEIVGIVVFALLIAFSIALHEVGHLVPAKAFGIKVTEYMVGFGPTVWSRLKGETRYGLKAIPLGGYIRMVGMLPPGVFGFVYLTNRDYMSQFFQSPQGVLLLVLAGVLLLTGAFWLRKLSKPIF